MAFWSGDTLVEISIHAPRAGSDGSFSEEVLYAYGFQSTLPVRGATLRFAFTRAALRISIHAPRAGSDVSVTVDFYLNGISIHAPRAGSDRVLKFQSIFKGISIHAPRAGSDQIRIASTQDGS